MALSYTILPGGARPCKWLITNPFRTSVVFCTIFCLTRRVGQAHTAVLP